MTDRSEHPGRTWRDVLLDIRTIIAVLFGGYGIICLIWGVAFNGTTDRVAAATSMSTFGRASAC